MEHRICLAFDETQEIEIGCRPNEDVVSAALRQGVLIVSDCRRGICGACRASLVAGDYDELLPHNVHALSDEEEENGWVLSCRLRPRSDLRLEFDYPIDRVERLDAAHRAARVLRTEQSRDGYVRMLAKTAPFQAPLTWEAGQYVLIKRARDSTAYRAFPATSDASGFEVEFLLASPPGTLGEVRLFSEGEAVIVEGPFGDVDAR